MNARENSVLRVLVVDEDALLGRFIIIVPIIALAGNLGKKMTTSVSSRSFSASGGTFVAPLVSTILILDVVTFLPALAPVLIVERYLMQGGVSLF